MPQQRVCSSSAQLYFVISSSLFSLSFSLCGKVIVFHGSVTPKVHRFLRLFVCSSIRPFVHVCHTCSSVFSNVCHIPSFLQCMSHSPEFSNVFHTTQFSPMYIIQPSSLKCMTDHPVFTDECQIAQYFPLYESWTSQFFPIVNV